jgi:drug/metabolite transporter (DMT)-like permease
MKTTELSTTGLLLATAASVGNVGFDVAAKRAFLCGRFLQTTLRIRVLVAMLLSAVMLALWLHPATRSSVTLFRIGLPGLLHSGVVPVLLLSTSLVSASILLYYRSLQTAPLSVVAPLFGLTPVFILVAGFLIFRQTPSARLIAGVFCILLGSLLAHWSPPLRSPSALGSFLREKGVGTMLWACLLLSITNLLDKWLVMRLDVLTYAWLYVVLCALFTSCVVLVVRPVSSSEVPAKKWIVAASLIDTAVLLLHFASLQYVDAVVTIAIKRSGMLLSVVAGAVFFKEQHTRQRLAAALVVLMGVFTMYFDLSRHALYLVFAVATGCAVIAILTSRPAAMPNPELRPTLS